MLKSFDLKDSVNTDVSVAGLQGDTASDYIQAVVDINHPFDMVEISSAPVAEGSSVGTIDGSQRKEVYVAFLFNAAAGQVVVYPVYLNPAETQIVYGPPLTIVCNGKEDFVFTGEYHSPLTAIPTHGCKSITLQIGPVTGGATTCPRVFAVIDTSEQV